jgi:hypothetical protein
MSTIYTINFEGFDEVEDYQGFELRSIKNGVKFFLENIKNDNSKIVSIIIKCDYLDRLEWSGSKIYNKSMKLVKEKNADLIDKTLFEFKIPNDVDRKYCTTYTDLIYKYTEYVKDLDFCVIFGYLNIEFVVNNNDISIVCDLDSESG